jgi:hypothetical protein
MPKTPAGWTLCRVLALLGSFASVATLAEACAESYSVEESRKTYFVGEIIICGTPEGVHEIATLRPASLPAERITALYFARSVFAFGLSGFTEKEIKRSTRPGFKPIMALTSDCGALDFRPRFANSASFSGISSNSKLSEVIFSPLEETIF